MDRRSFLLAAAVAPFALRAPASARLRHGRHGVARRRRRSLDRHRAAPDPDAAGSAERRAGRRRRRRRAHRGRCGQRARRPRRCGTCSTASRSRATRLRRPTAAMPSSPTRAAPSSRVVDVVRGEVVGRVKLRLWPRHLSISRDGRTLWVGLGTASPELAVVDVRDPTRPRLHRPRQARRSPPTTSGSRRAAASG